MEKLKAKMDQEAKKAPNLSREARDEACKKALAETFTPAELERMKGISNGDYHYLGAAKILAPIGKAFAEALAKMQTVEPSIDAHHEHTNWPPGKKSQRTTSPCI